MPCDPRHGLDETWGESLGTERGGVAGGLRGPSQGLNFPKSRGVFCPAGETHVGRLCPSRLHLHFASFQSVEVFRFTFAAMARGAQVRTPALRPTAAVPHAPTPAGVNARGL